MVGLEKISGHTFHQLAFIEHLLCVEMQGT